MNILYDIFSGARGMLKLMRNHTDIKNWRIVAGRRHWKNWSFVVIWSIGSFSAKQVGLEVNAIIRDIMGSCNSDGSNRRVTMIRTGSQIGWPSARECNTDARMGVSKYTDTHTHGQTHRRRRWQYPKAKTSPGYKRYTPHTGLECEACASGIIIKALFQWVAEL